MIFAKVTRFRQTTLTHIACKIIKFPQSGKQTSNIMRPHTLKTSYF